MLTYTRRELLGLLGAAGTGVTASQLQPTPAGRQPNILYIMSDDHAAHAISAYGSRINQTPNIDRLPREGMRFENAFVTNALCGPSRACLMTGKYSHLNGFKDNTAGSIFNGAQPTL